MSKQELYSTIEAQTKKLKKYEKKLGDVIAAYKSVVEEKAALEQTIAAFGDEQPSASTKADAEVTDTEDASETASITSEPATANGDASEDQMRKLRSALKALTAEKSRCERALKEDKKRLLGDVDSLRAQLNQQVDSFTAERRKWEYELNQVRSQVRKLQTERDADASNHSAQVRELSQKLGHQLGETDKLAKKCSKLEGNLSEHAKLPAEHDKAMSEAQNEIAALKSQLADAHRTAKKAATLSRRLNNAEQVQYSQAESIAKEQERVKAAEMQAVSDRAKAELRVEDAEGQIAEMAAELRAAVEAKVAAYDEVNLLKQQLSNAQIHQDIINSAATTVDHQPEQTLEDLRHRLRDAYNKLCSRTSEDDIFSLDPHDLLGDLIPACSVQAAHIECERTRTSQAEEISHLRRQLRQSLSVNEDERRQAFRTDTVALRSQVNSVVSELSSLKIAFDTYKSQNSALLRDALERVLEYESATRRAVLDLETQLQKQRERSLAMLQEKESEISALKPNHSIAGHVPGSRHRRTSSQQSSKSPAGSTPSGTGEKNFHYDSELARMQRELTSALAQRRDVEHALRELQHSVMTKELRAHEMIELLKEEIRQLEAQQERSSVVSSADEDGMLSIEYLKNVTLRYMLCDDNQTKKAMVKAIASVLKFTPKELQRVQRSHESNSSLASALLNNISKKS